MRDVSCLLLSLQTLWGEYSSADETVNSKQNSERYSRCSLKLHVMWRELSKQRVSIIWCWYKRGCDSHLSWHIGKFKLERVIVVWDVKTNITYGSVWQECKSDIFVVQYQLYSHRNIIAYIILNLLSNHTFMFKYIELTFSLIIVILKIKSTALWNTRQIHQTDHYCMGSTDYPQICEFRHFILHIFNDKLIIAL